MTEIDMNQGKERIVARGARLVAVAVLSGLIGLGISCENSDPTAPEGSTIVVSAAPQTVNPGASSEITATVRSSNGTRLPRQEVLFNTTRGQLTPKALTPILTDNLGRATSILDTSEQATVTASSGSISGQTTVNVSGCALQSIVVNLSPGILPDCLSQVGVTVSVLDTNGQPCDGETVRIILLDPLSGVTRLQGSVSPSQGLTNASGEFTGSFTPSSSCQNDCSGVTCEVDIVGEHISNIRSARETLGESIP